MSLEFDEHELKTILSWSQTVKGYWYLQPDEKRLADRISEYLRPPEPEPEPPTHTDVALAWQGMSSAERLEFEQMIRKVSE